MVTEALSRVCCDVVVASRTISDHTRRRLWDRADDRCAFPGCHQGLLEPTLDRSDDTIVGEECHIIAQKDSPRRPDGTQVPGGLYSGAIFAAASTSSGVSSTTVLACAAPDWLMLSASAAATSLLGYSTIA